MTGERAVPGMGLKTFHTLGSSGWKPDVDNNFLLLSALAQFTAKSYITQFGSMVAADGNIYIQPIDSGTDPNKIYVRDNGAWTIIAPQDGWIAAATDEQRLLKYNATLAVWEYLGIYPEGVSGNVLTVLNNAIPNSNFELQTFGQSGSGVTSATVADGWTAATVSGGSWAYNVFAYNEGATLPEGVQTYLSVSSTGTPTINLQAKLADVQRFAGRKVMLSIYGRVGVGGATLTPSIIQKFGTGGSADVTTNPTTTALQTMTGSFVRYTWLFSVPATSAKTVASDGTDSLVIQWQIVLSGTNPNLHLSCAKLEQGSIATPYARTPQPLEILLAGLLTFDRPTGLLSLTKGQLKFPAAQNGSSDPNVLDDYEEGAWTPTITFATPGNLSVTYSLQNGFYTKVGRMVTLNFLLATSAFSYSTSAGSLLIGGLPFACKSDTNYRAYALALAQGYSDATRPQTNLALVPSVSTNQMLIVLTGPSVAAFATNASNWPSGGAGSNLPQVGGTISYMID